MKLLILFISSIFSISIRPREKITEISKTQINNSEINQEINTIIEYPVNSGIPISYYYPYFVKSHIITYAENDLDYYSLLSSCYDKNCHYCEALSPTKCKRCATGYYLFNSICLDQCPSNTVSDTLRYTCLPITNQDVWYIKKYTKGSCVNRCGQKVEDCGCDASCKSTGTCCTDYNSHNCDRVVEKSLIARSNCNSPCEMCDDIKRDDKGLVCNQCLTGYNIYNNRCYKECPEGTIVSDNNICSDINSCIVENCKECISGTINTCKLCKNGFYQIGGRCVEVCPNGYRADRISWTCLDYPISSWYWIDPSKTSCKNFCGNSNKECSCDETCFRRGNCCMDVDEYCNKYNLLR